MHGGRSPVATTGRQSHDPEWRRPTQKVRKESRFEQWDNSCTANTQFHHKPGTGNPHRKTLRSRTKPWAEVWDYRHHIDEIPAYDPLQDPHCAGNFAWTNEHAAIRRKKKRRRQPLDTDYGIWHQLLRPAWSHHRQRIQSETEKRPWPECEPDASTLGGRSWKNHTADAMVVDRRQSHYHDGYDGAATQGNSDNYGICEESGKPELLMQTTFAPPWDHGLFKENWLTQRANRRGSKPNPAPVRAHSSMSSEGGTAVMRLRSLPKFKSPKVELNSHDRATYTSIELPSYNLDYTIDDERLHNLDSTSINDVMKLRTL